MYGFGHFLFAFFFTLVWRRRVYGRENIPPTGPLLLAANHASYADPPLVGSSVQRPIFFMAKEELFRVPLLGWVIRRVNAFPIRRREGDVGAIRTAERILAAGGAMIVFPEGRRQAGGVLGPPKSGVGLLAVRSGSPVVPVYVHNTHRFWRGAPVSVRFGRPVTAMPGESSAAFAQRVMDHIQALKEIHIGLSR